MSMFSPASPNASIAMKVCHVYPYTDTIAAQNITGYRNTVVRWKSRTQEDGTKVPAHTPVLVSVPVHEIVTTDGCLQSMLQDAYNTQQDALVRWYIEMEMRTNYNLTSYNIPEKDISRDAVAQFYNDLASDGRGAGKLSSKGIAEWFYSNLENKLANLFLEKSGVKEDDLSVEQITKLEGAVLRYKDMFMKLAAPKVTLKAGVLDQLEKALKIVDGDAMGARLYGVITKARSAKEDVELEDLL